METSSQQVHYRACHLCEALCGLRITTEGDQVLSIMPDKDDTFSRGFVCPKSVAIQDLHNDPDRLRQPMERRGSEWVPVSWEYAIETAAQKLAEIRGKYGNDAIGIFGGNPSAHCFDCLSGSVAFIQSVATRNFYGSQSQDQLAQNVAMYHMFGHQWLFPIADIDRTQYLLVIGANPMASNGSFMTVPDFRGRVRDLQARGGRLVVIDPRRSETAAIADEHHFVRPGSDPFLLLSIVHVLFARGWALLGNMEGHVDSIDALRTAVTPFTPAYAETMTGVPAATIEKIAYDLAHAETAACYSRIGASYQIHGTVTQWAVQLLNLLTGNLDREGGALFTHPAAAAYLNPLYGGGYGKPTRVRGLPTFAGAAPGAALAEEILTPGEGQIKAMFTFSANPVSSAPNGADLERAFSQLDYMVSLDIYINETTRHANLILPGVSPLERGHYDLLFLMFSVRNLARYNDPIFPKPEGALDEGEIFAELTKAFCRHAGIEQPYLSTSGEALDYLLSQGFYPELTTAELRRHPHGLDLGPLRPSLKQRLLTDNGHIKVAPEIIIRDLDRLLQTPLPSAHQLLLIGRRHIRSNNSWMHNIKRLTKGKPRHHLHMHPSDMASRGIIEDGVVTVRSSAGAVQVEVKASDEMMPGVASLPHGFGQNRPGVKLDIATQMAGVSYNDLVDGRIDSISGSAVMTGIPVSIEPVARASEGVA